MTEVINKDFTVSFITYIEFPGYKNATSETEEFISLANVLQINKEVIQSCIKLRKLKVIKLPDAIIAATAITHGLHLISRNSDDFKSIEGLELIDPWKL